MVKSLLRKLAVIVVAIFFIILTVNPINADDFHQRPIKLALTPATVKQKIKPKVKLKLYGGPQTRSPIVQWYLEELKIPYDYISLVVRE